jgi:hypothetical protein
VLSALKKTDKHPFIAKKQAALTKQFTSWKKSAALLEANYLAWYLVATDRAPLARTIVDEIAANVVFANNYTVWGPVADAICLAARLAREAKDTKRYDELMSRSAEHPTYAQTATRDFFDSIFKRNKLQIENTRAETSATSACKALANALQVLTYFAETVRRGGFVYDKWLPLTDLDATIASGLALLKERLTTAK